MRYTSIYWSSEEARERARWLAKAEAMSVSALVSALVNDRFEDCVPKHPPIAARCPVCGKETSFEFLAYWDDLAEGAKLYQCSDCGTTKAEQAIAEFNGNHEKEN